MYGNVCLYMHTYIQIYLLAYVLAYTHTQAAHTYREFIDR